MKASLINQAPIKSIWYFFSKIIIAIVSGMQGKKFYSKPFVKINFYQRNHEIKPDMKIHYHRPISRPVAEKQTLLKEIKKTRIPH